jgi:ferric-dicitrate binding protein FerR (iron transport regulator)
MKDPHADGTASPVAPGCRRAEAVALRRASGQPVAEPEQTFFQRHLARCEACRLEHQALAAIAHAEQDPAVTPLDDLSAQRLINDIVARVDDPSVLEGGAAAAPDADRPPASETGTGAATRRRSTAREDRGRQDPAARAGDPEPARGGPQATPARPEPILPRVVSFVRQRRRTVALALALVAVGLAVGLSLLLGGPSSPRPVAPTVMIEGVPHPARVLLRAGGAPVPREDGGWPGGAALRTGDGQLALQLGPAVRLWLGAGSELQVEPPRQGAPRIRLLRGELLAVVTPEGRDAKLQVQSPAATVRVTGTIFAVRIEPAGTRVELLRGGVRVIPRGAAAGATSHPVGPEQWLRAASPAAATRPRLERGELSPSRRRTLWSRADALTLLTARNAAWLEVRSAPQGAPVKVDGLALGSTPLSAALRPGHRRLAVGGSGHERVSEHVLLTAGSRLRRDFELTATDTINDRHAASRSGRAAARGAAGAAATPGTGAAGAAGAAGRPAPGAGSGGSLRSPAAPKARPRRPSWQRLLALAQTRRAAQDWAGAARAYRGLIRAYPRRPEARAARISLGFIQLEHLGRPRAALTSFEAYLAGGGRGPLAQEAAWGRLRALRRLGRAVAERRALRRYLQRYPRSVHRARVRRRLERLQQKGARPTVRPRPRPR